MARYGFAEGENHAISGAGGFCETHLCLVSLLCHRFARQDVKSKRPIGPGRRGAL